MIPKIIHYVWVGDEPKSDLVLKCIASWRYHLPDYEIMEWGNSSLDEIDNLYAQQAFENKKWAFVSDYVRLYALNKFGGFYFDTDLEITRDISRFRELEFVTGYEKYHEKFSPVTALMGSIPNQKIISDLLSEYDNISFSSGKNLNLQTNTHRISKYLSKKFNLKKPYDGKSLTSLSPKEKIYPYNYFCTNLNDSINYSIHHFSGSWIDDINIKIKAKIGRYKLVRYRINNADFSYHLALNKSDKIVFQWKASNIVTYCIIKSMM